MLQTVHKRVSIHTLLQMPDRLYSTGQVPINSTFTVTIPVYFEAA